MADPDRPLVSEQHQHRTDMAHAAENVRESEARFRLLVESVADYAIFMLDPAGQVLSWNKGAERFKGYKAEEIIGQSYKRFYRQADRDAGLPDALLAEALRNGRVESEGWRVRKDGTRFWADVVITAIRNDEGELLGFSKVTRDLTERKLAEDQRRQFELLVSSVTDYAILMMTPEGTIASWNQGARNLKGYTAEEIIGQPYEKFFTPEAIAAGKPQELLSKARTLGHIEDEGWRLRKDGSRFWASAVITTIQDENGKFIGYSKITRDLTERKQMEELAAKTAQLQASNRLKSEFLATMSHELRTPLNSIIGFTELVLLTSSQVLDELAIGNLNTVLRNARHLLSLISEILDLSKIEAGQSTVHAGPFDPQQLAMTVVNSSRMLAEQKGLTLEFEAEPGVDLVVSDETKVRQILINMVSNAVKFTDSGSVKVSLAGSGPDAWSVTVKDTGIGIAPDDHDLVFQEFRQVDSSTTRAKGGTGLGMAISRKLADLLEGTLTLESALGVGSTFQVVLPRQLKGDFEPTTVLPTSGASPVAAASGPTDGRPVVLAIDDDPETLHLIAENLKSSRYQVVTATSAESGLNLLADIRPAAITLDVLMPKIDGWMTLRRLKSNPATADIPVVLLSFLENKGLASRLGASDYLAKPIDGRALCDALDRATSVQAGTAS